MAASIKTGIRRTQPLVKELFRNSVLYRPDPQKEVFFEDSPQMVVLFTWVEAKDKTSQKYVNSWQEHGFNVMHITSGVFDLLMPKSKSEVTIHRIIDYLLNDKHNLIIHGLSVGGYLGTRLVMKSQNTSIMPKITHQIFDSFMHTVGFAGAISNSVPSNLYTLAHKFGSAYYNHADMSVFTDTEKFLDESPADIPTYYMHSLADNVAKYEWIKNFVRMQGRKSPTSLLLVSEERKIGHVNLYRKLGEKPYMSSIFKFLGRNNLDIPTEYDIYAETKELITMEKQFP